MTATATLVHTSSRDADNALRIARVAAAGRIAADRARAAEVAAEREAYRRAVASMFVRAMVADGAVSIGFKICDDYGKHRFVSPSTEGAIDTLVFNFHGDVEAWGIRADGSYCAEVW